MKFQEHNLGNISVEFHDEEMYSFYLSQYFVILPYPRTLQSNSHFLKLFIVKPF
jgi:hypothetical protein